MAATTGPGPVMARGDQLWCDRPRFRNCTVLYNLSYALPNDWTGEDFEIFLLPNFPSEPSISRKRMLKDLEISCILVSYKKKRLKLLNLQMIVKLRFRTDNIYAEIANVFQVFVI